MKPYWTSPDGRHVLYHGDCLAVLPTLATGSVDAVVTDPPYSSGTRREGAKGVRKSMNRTTADADWFGSDSMTTNGFVWTMRTIAAQSKRLLCRGGHFLSFVDWRMYPSMAAAVESADLRILGVVVWDKVAFGMGAYFRNQHEFVLHFSSGRPRPVFRHDCANVLSASRLIKDSDHDTQKPVEVIEALVTTVCDDDDTVLDPFTGSGTTLVACARTGRRSIGVELEERYCEIAVRRMERELAARPLPGMEPEAERQDVQPELFADRQEDPGDVA